MLHRSVAATDIGIRRWVTWSVRYPDVGAEELNFLFFSMRGTFFLLAPKFQHSPPLGLCQLRHLSQVAENSQPHSVSIARKVFWQFYCNCFSFVCFFLQSQTEYLFQCLIQCKWEKTKPSRSKLIMFLCFDIKFGSHEGYMYCLKDRRPFHRVKDLAVTVFWLGRYRIWNFLVGCWMTE
jgi:hypothetical protein